MKQIAVITGASQGLGLAIAQNLAAKDYITILVARTRSTLEAAAKTISDKGGVVHIIPTDVSDPTAVNSLADEVKQKFGGIDFLLNNAGVFTTEQVEEITTDQIKKDLDITLFGSILCTRAFIPLLKPSSRILFISSAAGLLGMAGYSIYCAAKAGVINFAESIRREVHSRKISVYVATPADIDTPAFREEEKNMPPWMAIAGSRPTPISAEVAAKRMLEGCNGKRFFIFSDMSIRMLYLLQKYVPKRLADRILDPMFPRPTIENMAVEKHRV